MKTTNPIAACEHYLNQLPLSLDIRTSLLRQVAHAKPDDASEALTYLHGLLAKGAGDSSNPTAATVRMRFQLAYGDLSERTTALPQWHIQATPPIQRVSMTPTPWPRLLTRWLQALKTGVTFGTKQSVARKPWQHIGNLRRTVLLALVLAQTAIATHFMAAVLPYHGQQPLETAMLVLFVLLCGWVSAGFWTALMGYLVLQFGGDRHAISADQAGDAPIDAAARTAIVMPICNEHVARVFAGLSATYESLAKTGHLSHFDFFVLSDSNDPDIRVAENEAWLTLCRRVNGFGRIFYRWRQHRIKRKSGNIADFCRRWGSHYRYMVVLDADSVMSGACLSSLVRLMETHPEAGIIQTAPYAAGRDTLYARAQQFAARVYGPLFVTGLHFWQLGESHYWGHNAIIRIAPFIRHCALDRLPGKGALSGEILSHDFVEAALMRRAGWAVWIAYDLPGSFEEMPPNLVDELQRDRRWCHGNLMNFRLFLAPGFHLAHRAVFVTGVVAYASAFLWFLFLLLSTWLLAQHTLVAPEYFTQPKQLFPLWPEWHPDRAIALFGVTATWLFLPKLLSIALIVRQGAEHYGGSLRLLAGMLAEWLFSMLLAPIRMLFHTQFVWAALSGWSIQWRSPPREDASTSWATAVQRHGWHTLMALGWGMLVALLNPAFLWWMLPILGPLVLSIPISVYSSSPRLGRLARKLGLFLIPEESRPPEVLRTMMDEMRYTNPTPEFTDAVTDPSLNALVCALGVTRTRSPALHKVRLELEGAALRNGPEALSHREKMMLLNDPGSMSRLHFAVWSSPEADVSWFMQRIEHAAHPARFILPITSPACAT